MVDLSVLGATGIAVATMLHAAIGATAAHQGSNTAATVHLNPSASQIQASLKELSKAIRDVPAIQLKPLGTIDFSGNDAIDEKSQFHDTSEFGIDAQGRIGFLTPGCDCGDSLVVVDRSGATLRTVKLSSLPGMPDAHVQARWIEGDRWIVQAFKPPYGPTIAALLLDTATGSTTPILGFDAPLIQSVAGTRDGGFVTLNYLETNDKSTQHVHTMHAYDAVGKLRWNVLRGNDDREASTTDTITVTTGGRIVVYESEQQKLVSYTNDGRRLDTLDLRKHPFPSHPLSGVRSAAIGGVFVNGGNDPAVLLLSPDGKPIGQLNPAYADGHRFQLRGGEQSGAVRMDSEGRLWASDGKAFLRLTNSGRADRSVGHTYDRVRLGEVEMLTVGPTGRIYAVDSRSDAVHVFDREGALLHVIFPDPVGIDTHFSYGSLVVTGTNDLYVSRAPSGNPSQNFVHFTPSGKLAGIEPFPLGSDIDPYDEWLAQYGTTNRWAVGPWNVYLFGLNGKILRRLEPAALELHDHDYKGASSAPDGSLLVLRGVLERSPGDPRRSREKRLELARISAIGEVTGAWPVADELRDGLMAYDGERVVFLMDNKDDERTAHVLVTDPHGKPLYRFQPARAFSYSKAFIVRRGDLSELWIWVHDGKQTIDRYLLR